MSYVSIIVNLDPISRSMQIGLKKILAILESLGFEINKINHDNLEQVHAFISRQIKFPVQRNFLLNSYTAKIHSSNCFNACLDYIFCILSPAQEFYQFSFEIKITDLHFSHTTQDHTPLDDVAIKKEQALEFIEGIAKLIFGKKIVLSAKNSVSNYAFSVITVNYSAEVFTNILKANKIAFKMSQTTKFLETLFEEHDLERALGQKIQEAQKVYVLKLLCANNVLEVPTDNLDIKNIIITALSTMSHTTYEISATKYNVKRINVQSKIRQVILSEGFSEFMADSFFSGFSDLKGCECHLKPVPLDNPMRDGDKLKNTSIIFSAPLWEQGQKMAFEFSQNFYQINNQIIETPFFTLFMEGTRLEHFFRILNQILAVLGIRNTTLKFTDIAYCDYLEEPREITIGKTKIGVIGRIKDDYLSTRIGFGCIHTLEINLQEVLNVCELDPVRSGAYFKQTLKTSDVSISFSKEDIDINLISKILKLHNTQSSNIQQQNIEFLDIIDYFEKEEKINITYRIYHV